MKARLLRSEFKKLTTTKTFFLILLGLLALAVVSVIDPDQTKEGLSKPFHEQTFVLFASLLSRVLIVVFGIRAITDEFRYGTIVPSLLVEPRRRRFLSAKAGAVGVTGLFLGAATWVAVVSAAWILAQTSDTSLALGTSALRSLLGMVAAGGAWALIGLGIGALVRNQVAAVVGSLVYLMALEDGVRGWIGDAAHYLPGQAGLAASMGLPDGATLFGVGVILAYALLSIFLAGAAIQRDVG